jgi:hypothetical protein
MGDYFTTKDEAVKFYKSNFKELEDKPDWMVESLIDFCVKYPNYKEYIQVEHKVKNNIELNSYEKRVYGDLDWENKLTNYKKNEIIYDRVDIKDKGEYDDLARDDEAREKLNKYNLEFGKNMEPLEEVTIKMSTKDETCVFKAKVDELNQGINNWTVESEKE